MKKFFIFALVLCVGIAFATTGFGQAKDKTAAPEKAAVAPEKPDAAKEEKAAEAAEPAKAEKAEKPKPKPVEGFVGKVTAVEGMLVSVKGAKESVTFDVSNAKFKGYKTAADIKAGDKVAMKYDKKANLKVTKLGVKKMMKAKKAKEKKEEKPAEEKK